MYPRFFVFSEVNKEENLMEKGQHAFASNRNFKPGEIITFGTY